ncbi:MobA/MobL family protein [Sphingomonas sp. UYP23]
MNSPSSNSAASGRPALPPPPIEVFVVLPDGSCRAATQASLKIVLKQARSDQLKARKARRQEKADELQRNLEDRAAARRLLIELAEIDRDYRRMAATLLVRVKPDRPPRKTSDVRKRVIVTSSRTSVTRIQTSSWVIDERGMRGVHFAQSYLGRKSSSFYRGAARDRWEYEARDEAVLRDADNEPIILSNLGEDIDEIGAAWQCIEDATTRKNGKIQIRIIVAFDIDASPDEQQAALKHFCDTVLAPLGLPYSAVMHQSPKGADQPNPHGHILTNLRPTPRVAPYCWTFADEVRGELDGNNGVQMLRHLWAHSMSEASERSGRNMRYTGLGYGARGLDLEPGEHLGEQRSAMVARGEHVWAHERNRIKNARNAHRRFLRDLDNKISALTKIRDAAVAQQAVQPVRSNRERLVSASSANHTAARDELHVSVATLPASKGPLIASPPSVPARRLSAGADQSRRPDLSRLVSAWADTAETARLAPAKALSGPKDPRLKPSAAPRPRDVRIVPAPVGAAQENLVGAKDRHSVSAPSYLRASEALGFRQALKPSVQVARPRQFAAQMPPTTGAAAALKIVAAWPSSPQPRIVAAASRERPVHPFVASIENLLVKIRATSPTKSVRAAEPEPTPDRQDRADPDSIAPFEPDGKPSMALRDVLLAIARNTVDYTIGDNARIDASRGLGPVAALLDIWRNESDVHALAADVLARRGQDASARWPVPLVDVMERHDQHRLGEAEPPVGEAPRPRPADAMMITAAKSRRARAYRYTPNNRFVYAAPLLAEMPSLQWLESNPFTTFSPDRAASFASDDKVLARIAEIDAYVADYGGGALELEYSSMKAVGVDDSWVAAPRTQARLTKIRADQQQVINSVSDEAGRRPLDFAKTGVRRWPRDIVPAMLVRLDRWSQDPGFQHDMFSIEQRVAAAYEAQARNKRDEQLEQGAARVRKAPDAAKPVAPSPDGFGGWSNMGAPKYEWADDNGVRIAAFDSRTGAPTKQLLALVQFAGEKPRQIVFASDDRLMATREAPAMMAALVRALRHDERATRLVVETVRNSRDAGKPVWPTELVPAMRSHIASNNPGRRPPDEGIGGPSR